MPFDVNNQFTGNLFGKDRIGHTTPDAEATETLRPWLPLSYPAPWLPTLRQDQGHPVLGSVVISSQHVVSQDKNGALIPAGFFCGTGASNAGHATGGGYCAVKYTAADVGMAYNVQTGALVAVAGEVAIIGRPSDGVNGDVITFPDGSTYTIVAGDTTFAGTCDIIPGKIAKPIGVAVRNVFQYLGGVTVASATGGMNYTLDGVIPVKFRVLNYMHEMATAIQTSYVLRLPWIGVSLTDLASVATGLSITGYTQSDYSRSFVHFTGTKGVAAGQFHRGGLVVASDLNQGRDAGNYRPYNSSTDVIDQIVGRIIGVQEMFPIRDYLNRVRTLWDPSRLTGAVKDPNPASIMMGGSATAGIDYQLNLGTDGLFKRAIDQAKTPDPKMYTYIYVKINL
jgi:hypothetical protein